MARQNLRNAIAETFLTGDGLTTAQVILGNMIDEEQADKADHDRLESLYALRRELRKLKESEA